jgi:hypothetical protein
MLEVPRARALSSHLAISAINASSRSRILRLPTFLEAQQSYHPTLTLQLWSEPHHIKSLRVALILLIIPNDPAQIIIKNQRNESNTKFTITTHPVSER